MRRAVNTRTSSGFTSAASAYRCTPKGVGHRL